MTKTPPQPKRSLRTDSTASANEQEKSKTPERTRCPAIPAAAVLRESSPRFHKRKPPETPNAGTLQRELLAAWGWPAPDRGRRSSARSVECRRWIASRMGRRMQRRRPGGRQYKRDFRSYPE